MAEIARQRPPEVPLVDVEGGDCHADDERSEDESEGPKLVHARGDGQADVVYVSRNASEEEIVDVEPGE